MTTAIIILTIYVITLSILVLTDDLGLAGNTVKANTPGHQKLSPVGQI